MGRDHGETGDRPGWWYWLAIVVVIVSVVALIVWTFVQTGVAADGATSGTGATDRRAAIAATAIP